MGMTEPNGLNLYAYCMNDPVNNIDPSGYFSWKTFWKGAGRVVTGALAVVAAVAVFASGVAPVAMLVVAGVTAVTGVLTAVNGSADIQQSFTGDNFVRDGLFGGNQTAYDIYSGVTEGVAIAGSAICGGWLKTNQPRIKAYKNAGNYVVKGRHLPNSTMNKGKFATVDPTTNRNLLKQAIKGTPMKQMLPNSPDSYRFVFNYGFTIGTKGQTAARVVFTKLGRIITFFPQ